MKELKMLKSVFTHVTSSHIGLLKKSERYYMEIEFNSKKTGLLLQHGHRVLLPQHGEVYFCQRKCLQFSFLIVETLLPEGGLWRGNWDKNAIESSFMPLDHRRYAI